MKYGTPSRLQMYINCDRTALHRPHRPIVPVVQFERLTDAEIATAEHVVVRWLVVDTHRPHKHALNAPVQHLIRRDDQWIDAIRDPAPTEQEWDTMRPIWRLMCPVCASRDRGQPVDLRSDKADATLDLIAATGRDRITLSELAIVVGKMGQ